MKVSAIKFFKKYHSIISFAIVLFVVLFSLSGIILNHRNFFSESDISRKLLPEQYRYKNWNLASVKGSETIGTDSALVFGNLGVYLATENYGKFTDYNAGFPEGIDNRKVFSLKKLSNGKLYAGTLFGLYTFNEAEKSWSKITLPVKEERITQVLEHQMELWVLTRSHVLKQVFGSTDFAVHELPKPVGYDNKIGLFKTLWVIHSGELLGEAGKLLVDFMAVVLIVISLTGIVFFFYRKPFKRLKPKLAKPKRKKRKSQWMVWHNQVGLWASVIIIVTTITGMFLRPPLLIPIANKKVAKIAYTVLDNANPWHDKLRCLCYEDATKQWIVATSEGLYYTNAELNQALELVAYQPPISVMGINVFERTAPGVYLIGSFSGMFQWFPENGMVLNYLTKKLWQPARSMQKPFGDIPVAGYITDFEGAEFLFDYDNGALAIGGTAFAEMPKQIANTKISLWNVALEVHTARIYGAIIGPFYILIVPLVGIFILFLIISGIYLWYKLYFRK